MAFKYILSKISMRSHPCFALFLFFPISSHIYKEKSEKKGREIKERERIEIKCLICNPSRWWTLKMTHRKKKTTNNPRPVIFTHHLVTRKYSLNEAATRQHVLAADPFASRPSPTVSQSSTDPISTGWSWQYCS